MAKKVLFLTLFLIFIINNFSISYSKNINNRLKNIKILKNRIAGIIRKPRAQRSFKMQLKQKQKKEQSDEPVKKDEQDASTLHRPIPQGKEFRLDIPGTRKRVLLFGHTSTYYIKRKVFELKKQAYVKAKDFEVYADRLLYFEEYPKRKPEHGKKQEHAQAWGDVKIVEKKKKVTIFGAAAFYFPKRKYMRITGGATMIDEKQGTEINGHTMERYSKQNLLVVTGNARMKKPKDGLMITAYKMRYNTKTKHTILIGHVRITKTEKQKKRFIAGDKVIIDENEKKRTQKIRIFGNGLVRDYEKDKLKRVASADYINYFSKKDAENKTVNENTLLDGHVRLKTEKNDIMAMKIKMNKDEKEEKWEFFDRVLIKDKKTKDEIRGERVFLDRKKDIMNVTENPQLYISKQDATVNCDVLKSYRKDKLTVLIGDVEIVQKDKKIYGEKAVFNEELNKINITGNPFLIDKENITYSEEIIFYTKKNEVRLSRKFHGVLIPDQGGKSGKSTGKKPGKSKPGRRIQVGNPGGPEVL